MRRVVITGFGVVSPVGEGKDDFFKNICRGHSGISLLDYFDTSGFPSKIAGTLKNFDPEKYISKKQVKRMDEFSHYAMAAGMLAYDDSRLGDASLNMDRAGVLVGSGIGGIKTIEQEVRKYAENEEKKKGFGFSRISPFLIPKLITNIASGEIAIKFGFRGPNFCIVTACATASHSIGEAFRIIRDDDADLFLAGGSESAISELGFGGFCALRAVSTDYNDAPEKASRPFDAKRDGFVMAEGAGVLVVEELEHALKRNAPIYAEIVGYGLSDDASHITAPAPKGEGAARSIRMSLNKAGLQPEEVDYINAHGTATVMNDHFETEAIKSVYGEHAYRLAVSSIKSMTGHMLGAAGAVEAGATLMMMQNDIIAPTTNYENPDPNCDLDYVPNKARKQKIKVATSHSFGFGGHNACLVFKAFEG
ncbi:beta-ketoacyl-[acyl-carrier-protein] synthase II [PVC group bacterium (ex Bugula neritina AB1)]|nr:beta-ketoacyl-[acyl-carrier-protein] synthase II [PVC group bacterium (ex Bugula neritina AB1)]